MTQAQAPATTHGAVRAVINANATDAESRLFNETVNVKVAADFGTIDSTKLYIVDGIVDMAGVSIEIPTGGLNLCGHNFNVSQLVNTAAGETLFTSPVGGSGDLLIDDIALSMSGVGSQVFNLVSDNGNQAIEMSRVNFNNCTSLGTVDNYRQGLETGTGRFGGTPSLTLVGVWSGGYFIDTSIVRGLDNAMTTALYIAGAGFAMASRFRSNQNIDLGTLAPFLDFVPGNFANPSTLQLQNCLITRNGVQDASDTTILPNISASDLASDWTGNNGIDNTFEGGLSTITSEVETVISTIDTPTTILATARAETDLQHFDSPSAGQLRHLGDNPREYEVVGDLIVNGTNGDILTIIVTVFDSSATTETDITVQQRVVNNLLGPRDVAFFNFSTNITLDKNDYAYLKVENNSGTDNITAEDSSFFRLKART